MTYEKMLSCVNDVMDSSGFRHYCQTYCKGKCCGVECAKDCQGSLACVSYVCMDFKHMAWEMDMADGGKRRKTIEASMRLSCWGVALPETKGWRYPYKLERFSQVMAELVREKTKIKEGKRRFG